MRCPFCSHPDDRVLESRSARDDAAIRRRRECLSCGKRYTTFEQIEQRPLVVVKKDGRRQPFDRGKLMGSMTIACQKRPVPSGLLEAIADGIEGDFSERPGGEVPTRLIGERVVEALRKIDQVAYVRFASVYRDFQDIDQFKDVVEALSREVKRQSNGGDSDDSE